MTEDRKYSQLELEHRALKYLFRTFVHDADSLLMSVTGIATIIQKSKMDDDTRYQKLEDLINSLARFHDRIHSLRDETTGIIRERTKQDEYLVEDIIKPLYTLQSRTFENNRLTCNYGGVPEDLRLHAFEDDVYWIFFNLCINVAKYASLNSPVDISARDLPNSPLSEVKIRNLTDELVPKELLSQLLEPGFRLPGETQEGDGLGLNIIKVLAERNGGRAYVDSGILSDGRFYFDSYAVLPKSPTS